MRDGLPFPLDAIYEAITSTFSRLGLLFCACFVGVLVGGTLGHGLRDGLGLEGFGADRGPLALIFLLGPLVCLVSIPMMIAMGTTAIMHYVVQLAEETSQLLKAFGIVTGIWAAVAFYFAF